MIRTIAQLKYLKAGFAVLSAVLLFFALLRLIDYAISQIKFRQKRVDAFEDIPTIREMNRMAEAVKEYEKELNSKTWFYSFAAIICLAALLTGAVFNDRIIDVIGIELFIGLCMLIVFVMILCILHRASYKDNACVFLAEYIDTLCHIYPDFHECMRLILSPKYISVPFSKTIAAIYRSVQEISDLDMLFAAGTIMQSNIFIEIAESVKQQMTGDRFYSKYYSNAFDIAFRNESAKINKSITRANIITITAIFICLFSLCLLI